MPDGKFIIFNDQKKKEIKLQNENRFGKII